MSDNVIEATDRFSNREGRQKVTPVDVLRRTARVLPVDRATLAARLGEVAARLDPDSPKRAALTWFQRAWQGERWAKRKRYVIMPGETARNPRDEGAYVASGADWAKLVEQAATALHPGEGPVPGSDRARAIRDLLRGTAFVPALAPIPVQGDNAQALIATYADRISRLLDQHTDIRRLWSVLHAAPFGTTILSDDEVSGNDRLLVQAALAADAIEPMSDHGVAMGWRTRFTSKGMPQGTGWSEPTITLGIRAHRRETRMFVVPHNFASDLPPHAEEEDGAPDERILEWLISKGYLEGRSYENLPDIAYTDATGIGWRSYPYEVLQFVLLQAKAKPDGSPGLWIHTFADDLGHYHPILLMFDSAAADVGCGSALSFIGQAVTNDDYTYHSIYDFVAWPAWSERHMPGGSMPYGAASGMVEAAYEETPEVSGWLDDADNAELQELLFGSAADTRFLPEIRVAGGLPVPVNQDSVAGALLANLAVGEEDRISERLLAKAKARADAGLAYHEAVVAHHRQMIDHILPN